MSFIKSIIQENESVSIVKYNGDGLEPNQVQHNEEVCKICFLDVETTGKNKQEDGIIELAMKVVSIHKETGQDRTNWQTQNFRRLPGRISID